MVELVNIKLADKSMVAVIARKYCDRESAARVRKDLEEKLDIPVVFFTADQVKLHKSVMDGEPEYYESFKEFREKYNAKTNKQR